MRLKPRVLATKSLDAEIEQLFRDRFDFHIAGDSSVASIAEAVRQVNPQGMVVRDDLPEAIAELAPSLVHIARHGSGVDVIPVQACHEAGICISRVPGGNAVSVAEWCLSQVLSLLHRIPEITHATRRDGWIAQALSHMLSIGLHAQVTVACRRPDAFRAEQTSLRFIALSQAQAALPDTEVLIPCLALSAATAGLINHQWFEALPARAVFVNASRGEIINESALCKALIEQRLAGAAIDVVASRSLGENAALWQVPQLIITPHLAGHTADAHRRNGAACLEALSESLLRGQCPQAAINPEVWPQAVRRLAIDRG
ncbi:MAG: hypothetical protein EBT99_07110 [Betaproteobacteria bacterium]|nr:hypothetical protein [Betaproteobacteria bacterium]